MRCRPRNIICKCNCTEDLSLGFMTEVIVHTLHVKFIIIKQYLLVPPLPLSSLSLRFLPLRSLRIDPHHSLYNPCFNNNEYLKGDDDDADDFFLFSFLKLCPQVLQQENCLADN